MMMMAPRQVESKIKKGRELLRKNQWTCNEHFWDQDSDEHVFVAYQLLSDQKRLKQHPGTSHFLLADTKYGLAMAWAEEEETFGLDTTHTAIPEEKVQVPSISSITILGSSLPSMDTHLSPSHLGLLPLLDRISFPCLPCV